MQMPRKPWEDADDYTTFGAEAAYTGSDGEERARRNTRGFVEVHVLPVGGWEKGTKVEGLGGKMVWWEERDGKRIVNPSFSRLSH